MEDYQLEQLRNLVALTQKEESVGQIVDAIADDQDYPLYRTIMNSERVTRQGGPVFMFQVNVGSEGDGPAQSVTLNQPMDLVIRELSKRGQAPLRHVRSHYGFLRQEQLANRTPYQIVDVVRQQRAHAATKKVQKMERLFWAEPNPNDEVNPLPIWYYVTHNASADGFVGGAPANYPANHAVAGIDHPKWNNYSFRYSKVTKNDLIRHMKMAATRTAWRPPIGVPQAIPDRMRHGIFCSWETQDRFETILESQNESLGTDLDKFAGQAMFRRVPIIAIPQLSSQDGTGGDTRVLGLNFSFLKITALSGDWWYETGLREGSASEGPEFRWVMFSSTYNLVVENRRAQWVGATV